MIYVQVVDSVQNGNAKTLSDVRRVVADPSYKPSDPKELSNRIFVTVYMGTENSSIETRNRAALLAKQIGSHHYAINIDNAVSAFIGIFAEAHQGRIPKFKAHGGTIRENVALQNVQARSRMVIAYFFAQLVRFAIIVICFQTVRLVAGRVVLFGSAYLCTGIGISRHQLSKTNI